MNWEALGELLATTGIYWLNGLLAGVYLLAEHLFAGAALGVAVLVVLFVDEPQQREVGTRSRRYNRGATRLDTRAIPWSTVALGLVWTGIAAVTPQPVPLIGLGMWLCVLWLGLTLPLGRRRTLHLLKWLLGGYCALLGGFWFLARFPLSPTQAAAWSERLQVVGAGEALEWSVRAQLIPWLALLLWGIYPATFFGMVGQLFFKQRRSMVSPWQSVTARLRDLRDRAAD